MHYPQEEEAQPAACRPLHDADEELLAPSQLAIRWAYMQQPREEVAQPTDQLGS